MNNWRGRPLESVETIVNLIAATKTRPGLRIRAGLDSSAYAPGRKLSKPEIRAIQLRRDDFHGDWNYTIFPGHEDGSESE